MHCLFHGSEVCGVNSGAEAGVHLLGSLQESYALVPEFAFLHLTDVVTEAIDHDVGCVAHGLDFLGLSIEEDGDVNLGEHAHCAWGLWGDGIASPCYQ